MPTGYTADVQSGTITTLREYALRCARAMGACVMMRDDPWDAPIPERFEPDDYNKKALAESEARLLALRDMRSAEQEAAAHAAYAKALAEYEARNVRNTDERNRYNAMLAQVVEWKTDAEGIRDFMLEQLRQSIDFDCHPIDENSPYFGKPKRLTGPEWLAAEISSAERDLAYNAKAYAEEVQRTNSRNEWLAKLRASLPAESEQ